MVTDATSDMVSPPAIPLVNMQLCMHNKNKEQLIFANWGPVLRKELNNLSLHEVFDCYIPQYSMQV